MKIGDYVRYYDLNVTEIGQIVGEVEDSEVVIVKDKEGECFDHNKNFIKSGSIIDVIEVGDYVNGYKVVEIGWYLPLPEEQQKYLKVDCSRLFNALYVEDIKSIVTHEQFERMEYKVGD